MQITALDVYHLAIPLRRPLPGPAKRYQSLETVLVRLRAGDLYGWGEASPGAAPLTSPEWAGGAFACIKQHLGPAVVGSDANDGDELAERMEPMRGNRFAKAALDMAFWDLRARQQGRPLHALLGGTREAIDVGLTFDQVDSHDLFLESIKEAFAAGFPRIKLKMRPGWEVRMLEAVRREFPAEALSIDFEGALTLGHGDILYRLDDFSLAMVEQPLWSDELVGHAMLQEALRTPICLDESISTPGHADIAFDLKSCQFVNLKPGRVGGVTAALAIHDRAHDNCTPCYVGAMPQTTIASRFGLALAAKSNCTHPADYFPAGDYLEFDLAAPLVPSRHNDGVQRIGLWAETGIGVEPEMAIVERCCLQRVSLEGAR
jgi:O-succinylbenzoate synthase